MRFYVNVAVYGSANPFTLTSNLVELGTRRTNWFDGRIDEVRVYNRALDASEIGDIALDIQLVRTDIGPAVALGSSVANHLLHPAAQSRLRTSCQTDASLLSIRIRPSA